LIVDDEAMIALHLAHELKKTGFAVIGPVSSLARALALIEQEGCDFAVLDVHLGQATAEPIARALKALGVPYVIATGYANEQLPSIFQDVPKVSKPVSIKALLTALDRLSVASTIP
jgi:two-component SAPR family response regulator